MRLRTRALWFKVATEAVAAPPPAPAATVTSVSNAGATEGTGIVHSVVLSIAPSSPTTFAVTLSGGTATGGGTDYTSTLTSAAFSNGVTISAGIITVPPGVSSFTVTVPTTDDIGIEGVETYTITVGGVSGVGTIADNDTAPGAGGDWEDDVAAPAGAASFTAEWGSPIGTPSAQVLVFGPAQLPVDSDFTAFPYRKYIASGAARSQVISGIAAGRYYWRIAPVEDGELGDFSQDFPEDAA